MYLQVNFLLYGHLQKIWMQSLKGLLGIELYHIFYKVFKIRVWFRFCAHHTLKHLNWIENKNVTLFVVAGIEKDSYLACWTKKCYDSGNVWKSFLLNDKAQICRVEPNNVKTV